VIVTLAIVYVYVIKMFECLFWNNCCRGVNVQVMYESDLGGCYRDGEVALAFVSGCLRLLLMGRIFDIRQLDEVSHLIDNLLTLMEGETLYLFLDYEPGIFR
jgi:hypothetical protein